MSLEQIWQQIKTDNTEIYGMKMLDVFLMLTKNLDSDHFDELTKEQKQKISADAALDLLIMALISDSTGKLFKERAQEIGMDVMNKFSSEQVGYILENIMSNLKNLEHAYVLGDNLRKLSNEESGYGLSSISSLLRQTQNKYNSDGTNKLLEQLMAIVRKYDLLNNLPQSFFKEDLLYFIGSHNISLKLFEKELKQNARALWDVNEILIHTIAKFGNLPTNDFKNIILVRIKELKEMFGDYLKGLMRFEDHLKTELKSKGLINLWDDIAQAIN